MNFYNFLSKVPFMYSADDLGDGEEEILKLLKLGDLENDQLLAVYESKGLLPTNMPKDIHSLRERGYLNVTSGQGIPSYRLTFSGRIVSRKLD